MKRFYLMAAMVGLGVSAIAQNANIAKKGVLTPKTTVNENGAVAPHTAPLTNTAQMKGTVEEYFSETFSNGLDGENGAWTVGGAQGDLWFQTFPVGSSNGYDPDAINSPAYSALPGYFGGSATIASTTADNGFMMIDADAYNSERFVPSDDPAPTDNPIEAFLISPSIDLTGVSGAALQWEQSYRVCCTNYMLYVDISFNGGDDWTQAWGAEGFNGNQLYESTTIADLTTLMNGASDLSDVQLRFRWPYGAPSGGSTNSHYFWMIDDVSLIQSIDNDLTLTNATWNDWLALQTGWDNGSVADVDYAKAFENVQTPAYLGQPLNFVAAVTNIGGAAQTGVGISATLTFPDASQQTFTTEAGDLVTIEPNASDTLVLLAQDFMSGGAYATGVYNVDISVFQNEADFNPTDNMMSDAFELTSGGTETDGDIYGNGDDMTNSPTAATDYILGQRYFFPQNTVEGYETVITGVEFVLNNTGQEGFNTDEGVVLYANVRIGSIFEDDPTMVVFGTEDLLYAPAETAYLTDAADFNTNDLPMPWAGVTFETPVPVDDNGLYQAEFRVPDLGDNEVSSGLQLGQEAGAAIIDNISGDSPSWGYFGNYVGLVRFRTASVLIDAVDNVSYEHGIQLFQNQPNPFRADSKFSFKLPKASDVSVEIHDIQGRLISSDDLGTLPQGVTWYNLDGNKLSPGIYTYTLVTDLGKVTRKMTIE